MGGPGTGAAVGTTDPPGNVAAHGPPPPERRLHGLRTGWPGRSAAGIAKRWSVVLSGVDRDGDHRTPQAGDDVDGGGRTPDPGAPVPEDDGSGDRPATPTALIAVAALVVLALVAALVGSWFGRDDDKAQTPLTPPPRPAAPVQPTVPNVVAPAVTDAVGLTGPTSSCGWWPR